MESGRGGRGGKWKPPSMEVNGRTGSLGRLGGHLQTPAAGAGLCRSPNILYISPRRYSFKLLFSLSKCLLGAWNAILAYVSRYFYSSTSGY